jgi:hypothetical protein
MMIGNDHMNIPDQRLQRYRDAYLQMARKAHYRPAAPSDGFGHVMLTRQQCADPDRLEEEATKYAHSFNAEEDERTFNIGCSDFRTNRAFIWTIEAARQLASGLDGSTVALKLLAMASDEVKSAKAESEQA